MKPANKPIVIGISVVAFIDVVVVMTMFAIPDLTGRLIPALAGIQILGFIAIAFVSATCKMLAGPLEESQNDPGSSPTQWTPWLLGGMAMLLVMRATLALLVASANGRDKGGFLAPIWFTAAAAFLLFLAFRVRQSNRRKESGDTTADPSKEWLIWLFGFSGFVSLLRGAFAIIYVAAHGWRSHQTALSCAEILGGCFGLYLAMRIKRSMRDKHAEGKAATG